MRHLNSKKVSVISDSDSKTTMKIEIKELKDKVLPILQRYGAKRAGLFGSYVRGEIAEDSDIDILVEIEQDISLLDFIGIKLEIEDVLGREVDLVEYDTIKPLLKERILKEEVAVL
jgi:predicted nucleotidyltransferase